MIITIDKQRIIHLLILITTTLIGGCILVYYYDWGKLAAYGFTCTLSCQISDFYLQFTKERFKEQQILIDMEKRRLKKLQKEREKRMMAEKGYSAKKKRNAVLAASE